MKKINLTFVLFAVGLVLFFAFFAAGNVTAADSTERMSNYDDSTEGGSSMSRNSEKIGGYFDNTARTLSEFGFKAAFQSRSQLSDFDDDDGEYSIYVRDTLTGTTTLVSADLDGWSYGSSSPRSWESINPAISLDGRYVAFQSSVRNLIEIPAGEPDFITRYQDQIYLRDLEANTTRRVSVGEFGYGGDDDSANPSISADGRYVAFQSYAENLDPDFEQVTTQHIYRADMSTTPPTIKVVSVAPDGETGGDRNSYNPSLSHNGQFVAFSSFAENLSEQDTNEERDVFIRNMNPGGTTTLVSVGLTDAGFAANDRSGNPSTSGDGRYVAFESDADDLVVPVTGDDNIGEYRQIYVRDTVDGVTTLVSVGFYGYGGEDDSDNPSISMDGRYVAFESYAENLVENDNNESKDIFVYDRVTGIMTRVNVASDMTQTDGEWDSNRPSISPDGRYVSFDTAFDFIGDDPGDDSWIRQVYRNDYFDQDGDGIRDGQEVPGAVNTPQNKTVYDYTGTGATVNITTGYDADINFIESVDPAAAMLDTRGTPPASLPCGLVTFTLNVEPGATVRVRITFPCALEEGSTYYKYATATGWSLYSEVSPDAVSISGNVVDLTITDGGPNDLDGVANGVIVDPSGPGPAAPGTPTPPIAVEGQSDGQGGCFISTLAN